MTEYRCKWTKRPTAYNEPQLTFVEAVDEAAARAVLQDYIERTRGFEWYSIDEITPYVRPTGGRVLTE